MPLSNIFFEERNRNRKMPKSADSILLFHTACVSYNLNRFELYAAHLFFFLNLRFIFSFLHSA